MTEENHHEEKEEEKVEGFPYEEEETDKRCFWEKYRLFIITGALIGVFSVIAFLLGAQQVCINDGAVLGTGLVCLQPHEVDKVCLDPNDWRFQRLKEGGINIDDLIEGDEE